MQAPGWNPPAWTWPLVVAFTSIAIISATLSAGPMGGLIVAALLATAIVVAAALMVPKEPIQIAEAREGELEGVLVICSAPLPSVNLDQGIIKQLQARPVMLLAPLPLNWLDSFARDLEGAKREAAEILRESRTSLEREGIQTQITQGDDNLFVAASDILRTFPAEEVLWVHAPNTEPRRTRRQADKLAERLQVPFRHLTVREMPHLTAELKHRALEA